MSSARSAMALALSALTTGLAGCTALGGVDASGEDGPLQVGATWTVKGVSHGADFKETSIVTAEGQRHGVRAFEVQSRFEFEGSPTDHFLTRWLRADDLARLEDQSSHHGTLDNGISVDDRSRTLYPQPCPDEFGRDLAVGLEWASACKSVRDSTDWSTSHGYSSSSYNHTSKATYRVEGVEDVTVAAGTFTAYRVVRTSPGEDEDVTTTMWVSEQACGPSRHPMVKSVGEDIHAEITMELMHHDCQSPRKAPWDDEDIRRWSPPIVEGPPQGWPEKFAPTLADLGSKFALMPVGRWGDGRPESNPTRTKAESTGYDDTGPVETYSVIYEVKGTPSDTIRIQATLYGNASHAQQASQYPIHQPDYECSSHPKVMLVVGAVMIEMTGSYWAADGKDMTPVIAKGVEDATAALETRFGVEAESCDWTPQPEMAPSHTTSPTSTSSPTSSSSPTGEP